MKVSIPFLEMFKEPMLNGQKVMTSRTKKYGNVGDTFEAFGVTFRITKVCKMRLSVILYDYYKEEGFDSVKQAIEVWTKIHPVRGYVPDWVLWVHFFERVSEVEQK